MIFILFIYVLLRLIAVGKEQLIDWVFGSENQEEIPPPEEESPPPIAPDSSSENLLEEVMIKDVLTVPSDQFHPRVNVLQSLDATEPYELKDNEKI